MGISALWVVAFIGLKARRIQELERSNKALQQEIQHREELESQLLRPSDGEHWSAYGGDRS